MAINVMEEIESTVRKSEQAVLDAIKSWAQSVQGRMPEAPVSLPFADRIPSPKALVSSAYDVAEALLAGQRRLAEGVLEAASPLFPSSSAGSSAGRDSGSNGDAAKPRA
jgi:hypothetical protein